jgi:ATP-dependent Clp protease adaptor protein ClpS
VLPGVGFEQGMTLANRIHTSGRAVVWSGHKEQAEHYWEQLESCGLTMAPLDRV